MAAAGIDFLNPPQLVRITQLEGAHERRISNWIKVWDGKEPFDIGIVGVPLAKGSLLPMGSDSTPNALRRAMVYFTTYNPNLDVDIQSLTVRHIGDLQPHVANLLETHRRIEMSFSQLFALIRNSVLIIVGGDGSITAPITRALLKATDQQLGMIQFDSRVDARELSDGGPSASTPLRALLERDGGVRGSNVFHLGAHGFVSSLHEQHWARDCGVTVVTARQVRTDGVSAVVKRALSVASAGTDMIYVSVDGTVLDVEWSGSTLSAAPGGLSPTDLEEALFLIGQNSKVRVLDLVGIDTFNDVKDVVARTSLSVLLSFVAGVAARH